MKKTAVIAIGGNSLIKDKQHQEIHHQMQAVDETAKHIVGIIESGYNVVITHGNGPQVGFSLLRSEMAKSVAPEVPLAVCGSETQGFIGYMIQQKVKNRLQEKHRDLSLTTVITQVQVNPDDPAFKEPTKPIGPFYTEEEAQEKIKQGWDMVEDSGRGFRRVVASPLPEKIVEGDIIQKLVDSGVMVIAVGGGGIPVVENDQGQLEGVPAVIDKDFASSLLAQEIHADLFIISTGVEKVSLHFNTADQRELDQCTETEARQYLQEGHFAPGSMKPKIEAALGFLAHNSQGEVLITAPEYLTEAIQGRTGTRIIKG